MHKSGEYRINEMLLASLLYAGWMHAGYPIMGQKSAVQELVDVEYMRKHGLWGPIHELGHNQQRACWEFPSHTTECTCNLWSVYVHEEVLRINRGKVWSTQLWLSSLSS